MILFPLRDFFLLSDGYKITSIISINHWPLKIPFSIIICVMKFDRYIKEKLRVFFFFFFFSSEALEIFLLSEKSSKVKAKSLHEYLTTNIFHFCK